LQPVVNKSCSDLADYIHAYKLSMNMKREKICSSGIWTAKKRYCLNVLDNEGVRYSEPKIKITGLEIIKSSAPLLTRKKMRELLKIIMNNTEEDVQNFIENFKTEFMSLPVESIALPRGVNGIKTYSESNGINLYKKKTPVHVKGCILYNNYLKEKGLDKKYQRIQDGEKIRFVYLKEPNPIKDSVISFVNKLPIDFGLHEYVDYNVMWEKTFIDPINIILHAIKWKAERTSTLTNFFGE
jgi:DNA polymerase elongation subunit (family B)